MRRWIAPLVLLMSAHANAYVDIDEAVDQIGNGVVILDVRNNDQFAAGHINNALQVDIALRPLSSSDTDARGLAYQLAKVIQNKSQVVVMYSDTDANANKAEAALKKAGFLSIVNGGNYMDLNSALFRLCQKDNFYC
ncbi:rhodanese-like domain-containing protein [Pseudomonas eucalypticola]|uniref:Rhodanese-like domain-containing protein n=1 Tax=Pseudomonas eucalypticola TaxID=2599595 RepID=A0A7D5DAP9_9PSED|nr:rhodanese-like domain-containing protein [Pseudomonas eucalypticola]QKZ06135.1 rhodanese-like domain-containing protein [Pseudomonas eucalypticola]